MFSPALATGQVAHFMDLALIDQAVVDFTGANIGAIGGARAPVDRRLRLSSCSTPRALIFYGRKQDSLQVSCPDAGSWSIFVTLTKAASAPKTQTLVAKGDRVSIAIEGRGFSVLQTGQALEGGAEGEWIRVVLPENGETIRARVERPGRVVIPLG